MINMSPTDDGWRGCIVQLTKDYDEDIKKDMVGLVTADLPNYPDEVFAVFFGPPLGWITFKDTNIKDYFEVLEGGIK